MKSVSKVLFILVCVLSFTAQAMPQAEKEWTFLVFINGHNNLSHFGAMNIKDMEKTGSTDKINLVVEWGQENTNLNHRLLVQKSTDSSRVTSPILMSLPDRDMGDYRNLVDFVKWGVDNFPARHYFVVIWNHGTGWNLVQPAFRPKDSLYEDISLDDNTGNKITTEQMGLALAEIKNYIGRNIDIYGSDACLMQMMEVATQIKDSVDYVVGSEDLEPGEGWPYETFIRKWAAAPEMTPAEVSVLLSKEYLAGYSGGVYGTQAVTFSALDMSKIEPVLASTAELVTYLTSLKGADLQQVKGSIRSVQTYAWGTNFRDYGHFLKTIEGLPVQKNAAVTDRLKADLAQLVMTSDNSPYFAKSTGVSVWIPTSASQDMPRYKELAFNQRTGWAQFLESMLQPLTSPEDSPSLP